MKARGSKIRKNDVSSEKPLKRKRWLIILLMVVAILQNSLEANVLLRAISYQIVDKGLIRIYRGVHRPGLLYLLGVLFVLYGIAGAAALVAFLKNLRWWHTLIFINWGACFVTIGLMIKHDLFYLGRPIIVPAGVAWGVEHQVAYGQDYFNHIVFLAYYLFC